MDYLQSQISALALRWKFKTVFKISSAMIRSNVDVLIIKQKPILFVMPHVLQIPLVRELE